VGFLERKSVNTVQEYFTPRQCGGVSGYTDQKYGLLNRYKHQTPWLSVGIGETGLEYEADLFCDFTFAPLRRQRLPWYRVTQADVQELPYQAGSIGLVSALSMLYYVPDQARAVDEIGRVLTPGGRAILEFLGWSLRAVHSMWKYPLQHYPLWPYQIRHLLREWKIIEWHRMLCDVQPAKHLLVVEHG